MKTISPLTKQCKNCKKLFEKNKNTGMPEWGRRKYCSIPCHNEAMRGIPFYDSTGIEPWNKGKTEYMSEEGRRAIAETQKERLRNLSKEEMKLMLDKAHASRKKNGNYTGTLGKTGELSAMWKGDSANYNSKHKWIQKHWTRTGICKNCGLSPKPFKNNRIGAEWHNTDRKYDRNDKNTWMEVCSKCHKELDKLCIEIQAEQKT